ncbi:hypothetical protein TNCV_3999601 [Trichonephila clavipes]|nr:hypothetical protein TNCV_3999601 [Trichonephila clavipes]
MHVHLSNVKLPPVGVVGEGDAISGVVLVNLAWFKIPRSVANRLGVACNLQNDNVVLPNDSKEINSYITSGSPTLGSDCAGLMEDIEYL